MLSAVHELPVKAFQKRKILIDMNREITVVINSFVTEMNECVKLLSCQPAEQLFMLIITVMALKSRELERAGGYLKENSMYHQLTFLYILFFFLSITVPGSPMHHTVAQMIHRETRSAAREDSSITDR